MGSDKRGGRLRKRSAWLLSAVIAAGAVLGSPLRAAEPSAADRETARSLMKEGDRFLEGNDATQALRSYQVAHGIMNVPPTGMAVVRALMQLGRLVEARDIALQVIRSPLQGSEPAVWALARQDAAAAARSLESRIAGLIVNVESGHVVIDGAALPDTAIGLVRKVDPGAHVVVVSAPGRKDAKVEVTLAEGETRQLDIELEPLSAPVPAPQPSSQPPPAASIALAPAGPSAGIAESEPPATGRLLLIGGASAAALGLSIGAITGYMAINRTSELKSACPSAGCPPSQQDDYDAAHRLATVSNISFAVGVVGIGVGAYGYYLSGTEKPGKTTGSLSVWPVAGLGSAALQGVF